MSVAFALKGNGPEAGFPTAALMALLSLTVMAAAANGGRIDQSAEFQKKGYRHWQAFEPTPIVYDYVAGLFREGRKHFYLACVKKAGKETGLLERTIDGQRMGTPKWLFSSKLGKGWVIYESAMPAGLQP